MEIIRRKNKTTYRETVYVDGVRHRSPTFERKTDARNWKNELLSKREKAKALGEDFQLIKRETFKSFSTRWLDEKIKPQRAASTYDGYRRTVALHLSPRFDHLFLNQLNIDLVNQLVRDLLNSGHNAKGINLVLQILKSIVLAAERQKAIRENPIKHYPLLKMVKQPHVFWSKTEIQDFLNAASPDPLYPVYLVALNTGMRRGELAGLAWDMVDFQRNMIQISRIRDRWGLRQTTKTGTVRHVPMNKAVKEMLLDLYSKRNDSTIRFDDKGNPVHLVFPNGEGSVMSVIHLYRHFHKMQEKAKIANQICFHNLRHTFASQFVMSGGNLYDLQKVLGHTKAEMTMIYAHLSPEHLSAVTGIINFMNPDHQEVAHKQPTDAQAV
ncbi:MAG: tyrosine-type recombinase/integrase [Bacteriovoracaceae bacterium]